MGFLNFLFGRGTTEDSEDENLMDMNYEEVAEEAYGRGYDDGYDDGTNILSAGTKRAISDGLRHGSSECGKEMRKLRRK